MHKFAHIGERIRALRERRGLATQGDLAAKVEVSVPTVSRWERGKEHPSGEHLMKLCAVLGVSPDELTVPAGQRPSPPGAVAPAPNDVADLLEHVESALAKMRPETHGEVIAHLKNQASLLVTGRECAPLRSGNADGARPGKAAKEEPRRATKRKRA